MEKLHSTVFKERHESLGARIVEFGGWEMPLQYDTGIVQEHLETRKHAGLFDISHMGRFVIRGQEALEFLQHVLTNNAAALEINESQYTIKASLLLIKSSKQIGSPVYPVLAMNTFLPFMVAELRAFLIGSGRLPESIRPSKISFDAGPCKLSMAISWVLSTISVCSNVLSWACKWAQSFTRFAAFTISRYSSSSKR